MSVISAGTTTTTAFKVTGDTTGTLQLQTGAVPTTAIDISATQVVTFPATTTLNFTGTLLLGDGSAAAPTLAHSGDTNTGIYFPGADQIAITTAGTQRFVVDAIGNIGVGVTPSAWDTSEYRGLQIGVGASLYGRTQSGDQDKAGIAGNAYRDSASWKYIATDSAARFELNGGQAIWFTAPSGTAGNTITFTQAMTLDASGNLGVGATSITAGFRGLFVGDSAANHITVGVRNTNTTGISRLVLGNDAGLARFTFGYTGSTAPAPFGASLGYIGTEAAEPMLFQTNGSERARITAAGDFGIGTTSPAQKLDVNGDASINGVRVGRGANSLSANTAVGNSALAAITSGNSNTAVGYLAGDAITSGLYNCAFGANALGSMTTGSGNCAFGEGALLAATTGQANTAFGGYTGSAEAAGRFLTTGSFNTLIGQRAGSNMSTGNENTIIGRYDANQANLDIRTASNYVVVSDGAGNPHYYAKATTGYGSNSPNAYIRGTLNWGTSGAELTTGLHASKVISADNNSVVTVRFKITASGSEWQPGYVFVRVATFNADASGGAAAWYLVSYRMYNGGIGGIALRSSGGDTGSFTLSVTDAGSGSTSFGLLQVTASGPNNRTIMDVESVNYNLIIDGTRS